MKRQPLLKQQSVKCGEQLNKVALLVTMVYI